MLIPRYSPDYSFSDLLRTATSAAAGADFPTLLTSMFGENPFFLLENARMGIYLLLSRLPPGEVILPSYICYVVPQAVVLAGHRPIFVDIDPNHLSMPFGKVEEALTPETRAIIAAHLFGIPSNLTELSRLAKAEGVLLIEDAAAAWGSKYAGRWVGTGGDAAVFSFGKGKALSVGLGGLLVLNNPDLPAPLSRFSGEPRGSCGDAVWLLLHKIAYQPWLYAACYALQRLRKGGDFWELPEKAQGKQTRAVKLISGVTSKLIERSLTNWESKITRRREIASRYQRELNNPSWRHLSINGDVEPSWACYPLLAQDKKGFFKYMQRQGFDLSWSYDYNAAEIYGQKGCENSTLVANKILGLPTYPHLAEAEVDNLILAANAFKV